MQFQQIRATVARCLTVTKLVTSMKAAAPGALFTCTIHDHDCVYSKNQLGFSIIIIISLGYQHSELHKSRSQRGAASSPPPPSSKKAKKKKKKKKNIPKPWRHIHRALLSMNYIPTTIPQPPGLHWDFHCALGCEHRNAPGKSCTQFVINRFVAVYTH